MNGRKIHHYIIELKTEGIRGVNLGDFTLNESEWEKVCFHWWLGEESSYLLDSEFTSDLFDIRFAPLHNFLWAYHSSTRLLRGPHLYFD